MNGNDNTGDVNGNDNTNRGNTASNTSGGPFSGYTSFLIVFTFFSHMLLLGAMVSLHSVETNIYAYSILSMISSLRPLITSLLPANVILIVLICWIKICRIVTIFPTPTS